MPIEQIIELVEAMGFSYGNVRGQGVFVHMPDSSGSFWVSLHLDWTPAKLAGELRSRREQRPDVEMPDDFPY